jgi:hypothetical protein
MARRVLVMVICGLEALSASAATVRSGRPVAFTQQPFADPTLPDHQDRPTPQVVLTPG